MKDNMVDVKNISKESHYKILLESLTDYMYSVTEKDGEIITINHSLASKAITGYSHDELSNDLDLWFSLIHPEDKASVQKHITAIRQSEDSQEFVHRIIDRSGTQKWVRNTIVPRFHNNKRIGYDGLIRDISDTKKVEQALRNSEHRYRKLLDSITDYIYSVFIEDGKVIKTEHGPACFSVTGYSSKDYAKDPTLWYEMIYDDDKAKVLEFADKAIKGETSKPLEHRIIHKNGSICWVRNTIVPRVNDTQTVYAYDGLISDITKIKEAEHLAQIQKERLYQAEKMATLGVLVSGVAHEINNPNNFIMLNAKLMKKVWQDTRQLLDRAYPNQKFEIGGLTYPDDADDVTHLIEAVENGGKRIEKIVKGLKDFSKTDSGELKEGISIEKVIQQSILIVNTLIKKSTNNFRLEIEPNLPLIKGNFQKLEQVIINLITNSCQAIKNQNLLLKVLAFLNKKTNEIVIQVIDQGGGISQKDMKHIFDPFYTTKRDEGGTGLGLSISYSIVKDHNGQLFFERIDDMTVANLVIPVR